MKPGVAMLPVLMAVLDRLDEYLQAALIGVTRDGIDVEVPLLSQGNTSVAILGADRD
jgi:hypothetical protein